MSNTPLLDTINSPSDLRSLKGSELIRLAEELRSDTISFVSRIVSNTSVGLEYKFFTM